MSLKFATIEASLEIDPTRLMQAGESVYTSTTNSKARKLKSLQILKWLRF